MLALLAHVHAWEREKGGGGGEDVNDRKGKTKKGEKNKKERDQKKQAQIAQPPTNTTTPVVLKLVVGDAFKPQSRTVWSRCCGNRAD